MSTFHLRPIVGGRHADGCSSLVACCYCLRRHGVGGLQYGRGYGSGCRCDWTCRERHRGAHSATLSRSLSPDNRAVGRVHRFARGEDRAAGRSVSCLAPVCLPHLWPRHRRVDTQIHTGGGRTMPHATPDPSGTVSLPGDLPPLSGACGTGSGPLRRCRRDRWPTLPRLGQGRSDLLAQQQRRSKSAVMDQHHAVSSPVVQPVAQMPLP